MREDREVSRMADRKRTHVRELERKARWIIRLEKEFLPF